MICTLLLCTFFLTDTSISLVVLSPLYEGIGLFSLAWKWICSVFSQSSPTTVCERCHALRGFVIKISLVGINAFQEADSQDPTCQPKVTSFRPCCLAKGRNLWDGSPVGWSMGWGIEFWPVKIQEKGPVTTSDVDVCNMSFLAINIVTGPIVPHPIWPNPYHIVVSIILWLMMCRINPNKLSELP